MFNDKEIEFIITNEKVNVDIQGGKTMYVDNRECKKGEVFLYKSKEYIIIDVEQWEDYCKCEIKEKTTRYELNFDDYISVIDTFNGDKEVLHIEYDEEMEYIIQDIEKLFKYLNKQ